VIDLDNNATTKPDPLVVAAMLTAMEHSWHNPSSIHRAGQEARRKIELARAQVAALIGVAAKTIVFTSGGTEAIDLAIRGALGAALRGRDSKASGPLNIVTTPLEHSAVRQLVDELSHERFNTAEAQLRLCQVRRDGTIDAAAVIDLIDDATAAVSVQWCNNETGAIMPVAEIAAACRQRGVPFHCDATQWVGKMPTRISPTAADSAGTGPQSELCDPDFLSFAPHKFHGPKGAGVLYCRPGARFVPRLLGTQELGRRGGTENVAGIIGCGVACELAGSWLADAANRQRLAALRDRFEQAIIDAVVAGKYLRDAPVINGPRDARRLWNVTNIAFPTLEAEALLLALSEKRICASAGAACSSGSLDPSPVLLAMGVPRSLAHGSIRFSLSRDSIESEVMDAVAPIAACVQRVAESGT